MALTLEYRGVQIGSFVNTVGGQVSRQGQIITKTRLASEFAAHLSKDSPNKLFRWSFVLAVDAQADQWTLEDAIMFIGDLNDGVKGDLLLKSDTVLKRTYPNVFMDNVTWTPGGDAASNYFSASVVTTFLGVERSF